jgi:O-antigen ligase
MPRPTRISASPAWKEPSVLRRLAFAGLLAFAFVLPWEDSVVIPQVGSIGRVTGLLFLALALPSLFDGRALTLRPPPLALALLAAFTLWGAATLLWTLDATATTTSMITLVQLLVMVWLVWELCHTEERRRRVMQAYVFGAYVAVIDGFSNYLAGEEATFRRFAATGFDPNDFAVVLALGIPMAWQLVHGRRPWLVAVNLAYIPAALLAITLSASRGGAIAATVALLVVPLGFVALPRGARRGVLVFGVALLAALPFAAPAIEDLAETSLYRFGALTGGLTEGSLNERGVIWRAGIETLPERPIRGVGLGAFPAAVERAGGIAEVAHNSFLSVLVETGTVGAVLFVAILLAVLVPVLGAPRASLVPNLVLFATLMVALLPLSWELRKPTWFVLSLLVTFRGAQLIAWRERTRRPVLHRTGAPSPAPIGPGVGREGRAG